MGLIHLDKNCSQILHCPSRGAIDYFFFQQVHFTFDARLSERHKLPIVLQWRTGTLLQRSIFFELGRIHIGSEI